MNVYLSFSFMKLLLPVAIAFLAVFAIGPPRRVTAQVCTTTPCRAGTHDLRAEGIASIRIVDQTGKEVMKDNEEATYVGEHFFYFTASDLPSGTYYYQIEFPQGVIIQNKTMLVVK
jgi:hypothetical protein